MIEPELLAVIDEFPDLDMREVGIGRANLLAAKEALAAAGTPVDAGDPRLNISEIRIPGPPNGPDIPVRIYTPLTRTTALPGFLLFHGGAFVFGDLDSEHFRCIRLAAKGDAVVVNVDYRLAPEHPFPAGIEDCYAALEWTARNALDLGIDPQRLAVGGGSAGGALSAGVAQMARDRDGPKIAYQMLFCPVLDDRMDTPSMINGGDLPIWDREKTRIMWRHYLQGTEPRTSVPPYAAPGRAVNLKQLPPAYIMAAQHDPLRDEAIIYATRLMQSDVSTELYVLPGTVHGFDMLGPSRVGNWALEHQIAAFRRAMHSNG